MLLKHLKIVLKYSEVHIIIIHIHLKNVFNATVNNFYSVINSYCKKIGYEFKSKLKSLNKETFTNTVLSG